MKLRGRVMESHRRGETSVYLARAIITASEFQTVEAVFEARESIPPSSVCYIEDAPPTVDFGGMGTYEVTHIEYLLRGQSTDRPPSEAVLATMRREAALLDLDVEILRPDREPMGRWAIKVRTARGRYVVTHMPGESWDDILALAGLATKVAS